MLQYRTPGLPVSVACHVLKAAVTWVTWVLEGAVTCTCIVCILTAQIASIVDAVTGVRYREAVTAGCPSCLLVHALSASEDSCHPLSSSTAKYTGSEGSRPRDPREARSGGEAV
jgi:hypothetical protein